MATQAEKAKKFWALHERNGAFIIPNPWDPGSARLLAALGFEALATTSSGYANSIGRPDGAVSLEEKIAHCRSLCATTDLPVSADLEKCRQSRGCGRHHPAGSRSGRGRRLHRGLQRGFQQADL